MRPAGHGCRDRDSDITMPLSLKTIGSAGYRVNRTDQGIEGCGACSVISAQFIEMSLSSSKPHTAIV